jgi:hypothetical protein
MLSTYLLDVIFIFLAGFGIETFAPLDPAHPAYGQVSIHAYYSHSLVGALLVAAAAGALARWVWGRRAGWVIGGVVFSHWLLDLVVHRPDLPILPAHLGGLPLLGFGLWQVPAVSAVVELALVLGGAYLYYRSARRAPAESTDPLHLRALVASGATGALLLLLLATDVLHLSILLSVCLMLLLIVLSGWLDRRLGWRSATA